jgi:hypothetical protein
VLSKARAGELFQALFFRRRHQPRRPPLAKISRLAALALRRAMFHLEIKDRCAS